MNFNKFAAAILILTACQGAGEFEMPIAQDDGVNLITGELIEATEDESGEYVSYSYQPPAGVLICQTCPTEIGPRTIYRFPVRISIPEPEP